MKGTAKPKGKESGSGSTSPRALSPQQSVKQNNQSRVVSRQASIVDTPLTVQKEYAMSNGEAQSNNIVTLTPPGTPEK